MTRFVFGAACAVGLLLALWVNFDVEMADVAGFVSWLRDRARRVL